jgi:chitin disaccharide deacetylase
MPGEGDRRLSVIVHADDCGLSDGITDTIVACHDHGLLHRASVVVNGAGWARAVALLRQRPSLGVALHLNLFEGRPLSDAREVPLLVDAAGRFRRSFVDLWLAELRVDTASSPLAQQIRLELRRQIECFHAAFGDRGPLAVDSHVHYHVIPIVLAQLLALSAEYPIGTIRLPRERGYWPGTAGAPRPPLINVAKAVVLRALCRRAAPLLDTARVETTDAFVGVLGTGCMTLAHVRAALERLRRDGGAGRVEILFHPGRARADEAPLWADRPELRTLYLSPNRDAEAEVLRSAAFRELLEK